MLQYFLINNKNHTNIILTISYLSICFNMLLGKIYTVINLIKKSLKQIFKKFIVSALDFITRMYISNIKHNPKHKH